jgi:AraC-like DNA-binding protein
VLANEELTRPARARFDEPAARAVASVQVPRVFSTVGLPEVRRIELWESHNAAALIGLNCHTTGPDSLQATELNLQIDQVQLARVAGSAHVVERTAGVIRRTPADAIAVYLTLRGDAWFEDEGGSRALRPGHILICDADRPFARGFARGLEELAIKVPRLAFTENTGLASLRSPVITDFRSRGDPYARALASLTGRAARSERAVPADERTILELVTILTVGRDADPSLAYRAAARCFIEAHLPDPGLTASRVAAAIGISERHLSRVFAAGGTSIPGHVLSRRLQLAYAILTGPAAAGGTVADVAAACGFTSAAYFSHVFREHFGQRAGEVRRRAQVGTLTPA